MTIIYLVRHCQYDDSRGIFPGRLPVSLSEEGRVEAERLRDFFADKNIDTIYSSAVLRCQQTSEIISEGDIPITYDQRLLETHSAYQGYWDNRDWLPFFAHRQDLGGESFQEIQDRMYDFFTKTKFEDNKSYIICSHGDPLFFLYQKLSNQPILKEETEGEVVVPPDYQPKGSIRPIILNNDNIEIKNLITQKDL